MKLIKALSGTKIGRSFLSHLLPGFREAYAALDAKELPAQPKFRNLPKLPLLDVDRPVDNNTYGPYNLPGVTVTAPNLNKPQPFPYGQINVEKENGRTLAYPTGNSPLQEAVFKNKAKRQIAGNRGQLFQAGGAFNNLPLNDVQKFQLDLVNTLTGNKPQVKGWEINDGQFNVLTAQGGDKLPTAQNAAERYRGGLRLTNSYKEFGDSVSVRGVQGVSPWYKKSPVILETIRHSKLGPEFNDTTYAERPAYFPLLDGLIRAATNSRYSGKRNSSWVNMLGFFLNDPKETPESAAKYNALQRRFNTAWGVAKHQQGGEVKSDNTRVASGRPQTVLNKIPWGAGKGPAADSPMRLFNDPYINMGLMAMAPMAVKIQSKNILAPAQSIKYPPVPTNQTYGLLRLYRAAQLKGYKGTIEDFITLSSEILGTPQAMGPEGSKFYGYNLERGNNVLYSRSNPENPKVEGLTVNEPARWQELLKKIIK